MKGISTRQVDDLVSALGIDGIPRSEVSRICSHPHHEGRYVADAFAIESATMQGRDHGARRPPRRP